MLPHFVNTTGLDHFHGVEIPTIPHHKNIEILIEQSDKVLLTVLEEQEGQKPDDPNYVLTRLGPIASGGCYMESESNLCQSRRTKVGSVSDVGKLESVTSVECIGLKLSDEFKDCSDACPCKCCNELKKDIET